MNINDVNKLANSFTSSKKEQYSRCFAWFVVIATIIATIITFPTIPSSKAFSSFARSTYEPPIKPLSSVQCSNTNFAAISTFDIGYSRNPQGVVTGDFDGDNKPDLATVNFSANSVSVLRNTYSTGSMSFAACTDFTVGSKPYSITKGDIDGDGKLDIIVTNSTGNSVSILRNTSSTGSLSFVRSDFSVGINPQNIAVGDIDGDGKLDLVVGNYNSKTISVLRNTSSSGSVNFATAINYSLTTNPKSIAIGDIDGDGALDIVVAHYDYSSSNLSIFRNISSSGSINLASYVNIPVSSSPTFVSIGDLDGDGKNDLAVINSGINSVATLRNTSSSGSISFATAVSFAVGTSPNSVKVGDIDGDAKLDLVITNGTGSTSTLRNISTSGTISFDTSINTSLIGNAWSVAIEDLDGDGKLDLAVLNKSQYNLLVLKNTTVGSSISFVVAPNFALGTTPIAIVMGDIDGDGKLDLISTNRDSNNISVLMNTTSSGTASFSRSDFTVGTTPTLTAIADIDGDGKLDLVVSNYSSNTVSVLINTSSSGSISFATPVNFSVGTNPLGVVIGDIDGDGKLDLAVANQGNNNVSVLINTSSSSISFASPVNFSVGSVPVGIAIGDVDGDGKLDLAVTNTSSSNVSILRNTSSSGSISFATAVNFSVGPLCRTVVMGDVDGDGKLDLAIANAGFYTNSVSILRNTSSSGSISFAARVDIFVGNQGQPNAAVLADVDGDGKLDILSANTGTNTTSFIKNTSSSGSISFTSHVDFMASANPIAVGVGDLDGNNKQDLVVVNFASNNITILLNTCTPIP